MMPSYPRIPAASGATLLLFMFVGVNVAALLMDTAISREVGLGSPRVAARTASVFYSVKAVQPPNWFKYMMLTLGTLGLMVHVRLLLSVLFVAKGATPIRRLVDGLTVAAFATNVYLQVTIAVPLEKSAAALGEDATSAEVGDLANQLFGVHLGSIGLLLAMILLSTASFVMQGAADAAAAVEVPRDGKATQGATAGSSPNKRGAKASLSRKKKE